HEVATLAELATAEKPLSECPVLQENQVAMESRRQSELIHKKHVKDRIQEVPALDLARKSTFPVRQEIQGESLKLPLFPTTTIGSFPQTDEVRKLRARFKKGELTVAEYET